MRATRVVRRLLLILALLALHFPTNAFGNDAKVYFEKDCLAMFSSHVVPVSLSDNETKVEEDRGIISFDKVVVSETQDGELKTYIKISNCRPIESH